MAGVLRQTCLLLSAGSKSCLSGGKCSKFQEANICIPEFETPLNS